MSEHPHRLADLHTLAVQTWLSSRSPDAMLYTGTGVKASSTGIRVPLLNLALGAHYSPDTPIRVIDDEIEAVKTFFEARGVPWYWWLGITTSPPDMPQHLERHGLIFDRPVLPAMIAELPVLLPATPPDIHVWQAATLVDLQAASFIRRIAFRFPEGMAVDYFDAMADSWLAGDPAKLYLACVEGQPPAAIGALIMGEGIPGVYVMATLPEWRQQGLGKAILARILTEAAGHERIVLTASRMGYPLYQQFGFQQIFDYTLYSWTASPTGNSVS